MPKIRPGETEPQAYITVRLPADLYKTVRELALKHDVTLGEAFRLLLDKVRLEAYEEALKERKKK